MSKSDRNRQRTRAKVAQMRALEARRRRNRRWLTAIGAAVVVIGAAVGISLAVTGGGSAAAGGPPRLHLAALSSLGTLQPAPRRARLDPRAFRSPARLSSRALGRP